MSAMVFPSQPFARRRLLIGAGVAGAAACTASPAATTTADQDLDPHGPHQAGVDRPLPAQRHCRLSIWDLPDDFHDLKGFLAGLGVKAASMAGSARFTMTVGLGPRVVRAIDPDLPGASDLPVFARERITPEHRGGDLMIQLCADDPFVASARATELHGAFPAGLKMRWRQTGFQGTPVPGTGAGANLFGFADGIAGPKGRDEFDREVWLDEPAGRARGGTIAVVRRILLDVPAFLALPVTEQERIFGRRKTNAEPLSGAGDVDLGAKTPAGEYLIPADAHVRRAHPLPSGVGFMLRRSYNIDDVEGPGLLFLSFQRELRTFTATHARLDEADALMRFTTTTASGTFLVLPGFTPSHPLGSSLLS